MNKIACITLDIEGDYHREHFKSYQLVKKWLIFDKERLNDLFKSFDVKITAFIVGEILEKMPSVVESLMNANMEVELHSYSHSLKRIPSIDIPKCVNAYNDIFGKMPLGYRAPEGILKQDEIKYLIQYGFKFDSSVFPFFRPGKFINLRYPQQPFFLQNTNLIELPIGSIPIIRLPIALSYIMSLGWDSYKTMLRIFGLPTIIIFDFHLHDLFPSKSFQYLSNTGKLLYSTIYRKNPLKTFKNMITFLKENNYSFLYMKDLYDKINENDVYLNSHTPTSDLASISVD